MLLFVNISQDPMFVHATLGSLKFADKVRKCMVNSRVRAVQVTHFWIFVQVMNIIYIREGKNNQIATIPFSVGLQVNIVWANMGHKGRNINLYILTIYIWLFEIL